MKKAIKILTLILSFQTFAEWHYLDDKGNCQNSQGLMTPSSLLKSSTGNCSTISETKNMVEIKCLNMMKGNPIKIYRSKSFCMNDGNNDGSIKTKKIKEALQTKLNQNLWYRVKRTCPENNDTGCMYNKNGAKTKDILKVISKQLSSIRYKCSNSFEDNFILNEDIDNLKMFLMCVRPSDLCSVNINWYDSEEKCKNGNR